MGKSVGLPGVLVFIAVIIGGNIGGILGVLFGVPTASAIYALVINWLKEKKQEKRNSTSVKQNENKEDNIEEIKQEENI